MLSRWRLDSGNELSLLLRDDEFVWLSAIDLNHIEADRRLVKA
jgi:hypothetical protein